MKCKCFYIVFLALISSGTVNAQANLLNSTKAEKQLTADNEKPLPYGYIGDRDIFWSIVLWEFIDLNQKINFPYFHTTNISGNRHSLFDTLIKGIETEEIKEVYSDSFFKDTITSKEILSKMINIRKDGNNIDTFKIKTQDIVGYKIRGMYYFDRRIRELKYRPLGIAPMGPDVQTMGVSEIEDDNLYELFWVFYPSARQLLYDTKVFNTNSLQQISFDHLLNRREFISYTVKEKKMYRDSKIYNYISDYMRDNPLFQLMNRSREGQKKTSGIKK